MSVFADEIERMVFVTMLDINDRWTKDLSIEDEYRYYREIIRRLQDKLPEAGEKPCTMCPATLAEREQDE